METNIKIAILLLCYRDSKIVNRALHYINIQTKKQNTVIYLINDCSPNTNCEYQDIIKKYPSLNIKYFKTEKNSGPSIARQFGLNQIKEKYLIFHDDDDFLYDEYVIENYILEINKNNNFSVIQCPYILIKDEKKEIIKNDENTNFLCRLYNKEFLDKFNIKFNKKLKTRCEDFLFYLQIEYFSQYYEYNIIYADFYNYIFYHSKIESSLTWPIITNNNDTLKYQIEETFYCIIFYAELIKFYKKQEHLTKEILERISLILRTIYLSSSYILNKLECYSIKDFYSNIELSSFYNSWIFLINLIEKNKQKIIIKYYGPINFMEENFINFCNSFEERWNKLTK